MERGDLQRLTKEELIDLVLKIQRPEKTSRTSSKPPSSDRKERREQARPGGAKPGHEGHSRAMGEDFDRLVDHRPEQCPCCQSALADSLPAEIGGTYETVDLPEIKPFVTRHRRLSLCCPSCGTLVLARVPDAAKGSPFGPRLHAVATYLKTFQALSYERLQNALADLFGLQISQGGLMNMLRRAQGTFVADRDLAIAALRRSQVVASDETGVRIEGSNAFQWVFRCDDAVVHRAAPTRGAIVVRTLMDGHRQRSGVPIATLPSRDMPTPIRPASLIWPATSPTPNRRARICCRRGCGSGCPRHSLWRAASLPSPHRPSSPSAVHWNEVFPRSSPPRPRAHSPAWYSTSSGGRATNC